MAGEADSAVSDAGPPRVSVVVPTRERPERLDRLLGALAAQTLPGAGLEVIVVDDGGLASTRAVTERWAATERLALRTATGERRGPAAARNAGLRLATAPLVAFTDDDCEPEPGWLDALLDVAERQPGCLVQGRTVPNRAEAHLLAGPSRTKSIEALGPWFQTCNVLYPRAVLDRVSGFDEAFTRPFGEDADLAWRAIESGAGAAFAPAACVEHAVEPLSPLGFVRAGLRDPDEALLFKRHPRLRAQAGRLGVFKSESHALLALAIGGLLAARRRPAAAAAILPYARLVAARSRHAGAGLAPLVVGHDLCELASAARGSLRHGVMAL